MKRRDPATRPDDADLDALVAALLSLRAPAELRAFLEDLCTPAELEALTDRWRVIPLLQQGVPYREIHERTGVSVTTIGRVSRCLERGTGGYRIAAQRHEQAQPHDAAH